MALGPVSVSGITQALGPGPVQGPSENTGTGFPKMLDQLMSSAGRSHHAADEAVQAMATGQTDNLHEVMLQMAQADLSFHLILEIRNRLTDAYQEIMKMQV
jgi:flagellar hook-basal body complex protein FliE